MAMRCSPFANRGEFSQQLHEAPGEHAAHDTPLAVMRCDVDAFTACNDIYGHLAGHAALTAVASTPTRALRCAKAAGRDRIEAHFLAMQPAE